MVTACLDRLLSPGRALFGDHTSAGKGVARVPAATESSNRRLSRCSGNDLPAVAEHSGRIVFVHCSVVDNLPLHRLRAASIMGSRCWEMADGISSILGFGEMGPASMQRKVGWESNKHEGWNGNCDPSSGL